MLSCCFALFFFISCSKSHSVKICNVVSSDGKSVKILAGTYHPGYTVVGGVLLTYKGVQTRYDFTGWEDDQDQKPSFSVHVIGIPIINHASNMLYPVRVELLVLVPNAQKIRKTLYIGNM